MLQLGVYEEVERVINRLKGVGGVLGVILYGSYARGDYDEGSDVDILVIFRDGGTLREKLDEVYGITAETDLFIQVVALTLGEFRDSALFRTVLREGKICYAKPEFGRMLNQVFKPYVLITYSTSNLSERERVLFAYEMEGRRSGKYVYQGILQELGGFKVGRGVIMVPVESLKRIIDHLEGRKVDYKLRYVWA
ncbi:MAG: nucleotidyltransferase domain-containing protein [Candidatus Jordarchaeaceae archaeon]